MRKRILSLTLVLALMASLLVVSSAKADVTQELAHKSNVLMGLGIITPRDFVFEEAMNRNHMGASGEQARKYLFTASEYDLFRDISKRSFINYICNIYGDYGFSEQYSEEAVRMAEASGIIHAGQTDLYKPLNYEEAVTMIVRALGYGTHAEEGGGFPYGYISIANKLGITDGISANPGDRLQGNDAVILLYNAINCPYVEIYSITDEGIVYGNTSESTILYEYRKIYRVEGVVNATPTAALRTEIGVSDEKIMIDGYVYNTDESYDEYLGMNVEAYVREKADYDELIMAFPYDNREIVIKSDDMESINDDCTAVKYYEGDDKIVSAAISEKAAVIYNGQPIKGYTKETLMPGDGSIRLVDSGNGGAYDTVFVTDYKTVVADSISSLNKTVKNIYTHNKENLSLNLYNGNEDVISVTGEDGTEYSVSDLESGDVLKVTESVLGKRRVIRAYLSRTKVSGTVLNITKGDKTEIVVDDRKYTLSDAYEEALAAGDTKAQKIEVGKSYTFSLDCGGEIAFATDTDGLMKYAIVYAASSYGVFDLECRLKLFTTEGEWKELCLADKTELDDKGRLEAGAVIGQIPVSGDGVVSVIGYVTNSDGEISKIDLPEMYKDGNDGDFNMKDKATLLYRTGNVSFDSQTFIKDNALFWSIDTASMNETKAYQIIPKKFESNEKYTFYAFNVDEYNFSDMFVILQEAQDAERDVQLASLMVVESVGEASDAEGDVVTTVTGAMGEYTSVTYFCENDVVFTDYASGNEIPVTSLKCGDAIAVTTNNDSRIIRGKKFRSADDGVIYENPATLHITESIVQGVIRKADAIGLRVKVDCGEFGMRDMRIPAVCPIYIFDLEKDELRRGTLNDVEENNTILIKNGWNYVRGLVVYQ